MLTGSSQIATSAEATLLQRNHLFADFFRSESTRLAECSREMAGRFLRGGRLLAFGRGPYMTDAQHVSVEFVHPVIVGKRALPAIDMSMFLDALPAVAVCSDDIVIGFGPPEGDAQVNKALQVAAARGAMTLALPGQGHSYSFQPQATDPFLHQEMMEVLYHTLWETVHVFLERRSLGSDAGASAFLYPFLGGEQEEAQSLLDEAAASIQMKVEDDATLRTRFASEYAETIGRVVESIDARIARGGKLIVFGNGGSATDANDFAIDCLTPPGAYQSIAAISLSMEPACITAIGNDVGTEVIFLRQLIAQARPEDIAVGISTSGGSRNIVAALEEARKRGLLTVGLLGYDGGEILRRGLVDHALIVRSNYIPRIQEVQASVYHTIRELMGRTHAEA